MSVPHPPARSRALLSVVALTAAGLAGIGLSAAPAAAAAAPSVQKLCSAAAPGYASCFAERVNAGATAAAGVSPFATPSGYGPADLTSAYNLDPSKGYGQTVAIVDAYDDPHAESDLAVYRSQYGLPSCTTANGCFRKVNQAGNASPLPTADTGWAGEISLDLDMVSAVCPQCDILLVEANSSSLSDLGTSVNTAVRLGAKFVSNSYGGSEGSWVTSIDSYYNHPGVAITASTGDSGYGVAYPASSQYVTAVGGTTLSRSPGTSRGWSESAWSGAGSGCSGYEAAPSFQTNAGTGCSHRAMADVSAVANPNTGVAVYVTYGGSGWNVYGGTSAASPIIAATYALAGTPGASDYPNTYPYTYAGQLNDVTSGNNGSCPTARWCWGEVGWDGPTGLGTPDTAAAFSATGTVTGSPARFGLTGQSTSAVVAGLPVGLSATPQLPDGDALASINWKAARSDCTFDDPTSLTPTVTCPATLTGTTTVTATAVDTAQVSKALTLSLTFSVAATKRPVSISLGLVGQGPNASMCAGVLTPTRAVVTDTATGRPVKGLAVTFTRAYNTSPAGTAGAATTLFDGTATANLAASATAGPVTLGARSAQAGSFAANPGITMGVSVGHCTVTLAGSPSATQTYYGDPVTITGTATRDASGQQVALPGAPVQVVENVNGRNLTLGTATSNASGALQAVIHPTASGTLSLVLPAGTGWLAATTTLGPLTVLTPNTLLTAAAGATDVGYGSLVTVTGTLRRDAGGTLTPLARSSVSIRSTAGTKVTVLGSASVGTDGTFTAKVYPRAGGELSAVYAGAAGQPAATADAGPLTVGTWTSAVTAAASASVTHAGVPIRVSGTVMGSYGGRTVPAPGVTVSIYLTGTTGVVSRLATIRTSTAGTYTALVAPRENGTLMTRLGWVVGYTNADSAPMPVAVISLETASVPAVVARTSTVPVTTTIVVGRRWLAWIQEWRAGHWVTVLRGWSDTNGRAVVRPRLGVGVHVLRVYFAGDSRGHLGASPMIRTVVR